MTEPRILRAVKEIENAACDRFATACASTALVRLDSRVERHRCHARVGHDGQHVCSHGWGWSDAKAEKKPS